MKVISAFAGIGGAELALKRLNIEAKIYAYEIDKYAEAVNRFNNPDSFFLGNILDWHLHKEIIGQVDLIIGGSPCQDLSCAGKCAGLKGKRSGLFYVFLEMINFYKPRYFILENVASMSKDNANIITQLMGVEPVMLNAALVSAQQRKRLFWTNIPASELLDKRIVVKDILENESSEEQIVSCMSDIFYKDQTVKSLKQDNKYMSAPVRVGHIGKGAQGYRIYDINGKTVSINANGGGCGANTGLYMISTNKPNLLGYKGKCKSQSQKIYGINGKTPTITRAKGDASSMGLYKIELPDGNFIVRKLTPIEVERAFTIPDNYTKYGKFKDGSIKHISNTQRYKMLGNGFVVDVLVEGLLKNLGKQKFQVKHYTIEDYL